MHTIKFRFASLAAGLALASACAVASANNLLTEGFNGPGLPAGWVVVNNSTPGGLTSWFHGSPALTTPFGAPDSYVAANFLNAPIDGLANDISDWLLTPTLQFYPGDVLTFFTSTLPGSTFGDRLQVRLSTSGSSTNVGSSTTSVGDFTTLLTDINPTAAPTGYPDSWTAFTVSLAGLTGPAQGRLAFRYLVTDNSVNGDFVALDSVSFTSTVPEPATPAIVLLGLAGIAATLRRRNSRS